MSGLYEVTEESMIQAHQAGIAYWTRNKPTEATKENIASLARSRHWHDGDCDAFVAGFFGAKRRAEEKRIKGDCSKWGVREAIAQEFTWPSAPEYNRR